MNYPLLQTYLQTNILTTEINNNQETVTALKPEFLTANNLTADPKLTEVLTRFYQSVKATIIPHNKYYSLPAYANLTTLYYGKFFTSQKPNLGVKSTSEIEEAISDEHYQLLDKILVEFKASLPQKENENDQEEEETPLTLPTLTNQATTLEQKLTTFLTSQGISFTSESDLPIIKQTLLANSQGQVILGELKAWLRNYSNFSGDKTSLADKFSAFQALDQTQTPSLSQSAQTLQTQANQLFSELNDFFQDQDNQFTDLRSAFQQSQTKVIKLAEQHLTGVEGQAFSQRLTNWVKKYKQLPNSEQLLLEKDYLILGTIQSVCELQEEETTTDSKEQKDKSNKEGLLYLGGGILILGIVILLFSKRN